MVKIVIIGSSKIVEHHIEAFSANNFKIPSIASSRKNSFNSIKIARKYNLVRFDDWREMILNKDSFDSILIASKVEYTLKILDECLKTKKKILIEKPIAYNSISIKKYFKFSNQIQVLYNRRFYNTINYLYSNIKNRKNIIIDIKLPEKNIKKLIKNGSHGIDIINFIFMNKIHKFKIKSKITNKKYITAIFIDDSHNYIRVMSYFNAAENFSISFYNNEILYKLMPYEELNIYKGMKIINETKKTKIKKYLPRLIKKLYIINNKFKPGFYEQANSAKKFIQSNIVSPQFCSIKNAYSNIKFLEKLLN